MNPYDQIITKHAELSGIIAKCAAENRAPSEEEKGRLTTLQGEINAIKATWESTGRAAFLASLGGPKPAAGPMILKADQKYADAIKGSYPSEYDGLSLGRLLKGWIGMDWSGCELEQKAMASSPTTAGGILIPAPLSARIIDRARNLAAVMRAGASIVPMSSATLTMARLTTDPTAAWTSEADAIATSDAVFDSVVFTARKLAALCVINNELLADGQGVDAVLEMALAKALAGSLDLAGLVGSGIPPVPTGIQNTANINTLAAVGVPDFDDFLTAIYEVRKDNYEPNAVIYAARTGETMAKKKAGDGYYLTPPPDWNALSKYVSNQVPVNLGGGTNESLAFVGQWDQLAIGMRSNITIEVAREGSYTSGGNVLSAFERDQTLVRAVLRADVQALQPAAFCVMSGITA